MTEIEVVRERLEPKLLEFEGIVGISHKNPKKFVIYVEDEKTAKRVPSYLAGYPVETVVAGRVRALPLVQAKTIQRVRPLVGGLSIGPPAEVAGTLGIIINGRILTNAHVIGIDWVNVDWYPTGTPIYQPSLIDGGKEEDVVGYLSMCEKIHFNAKHKNVVDVALADCTADFREMEVIQIGKISGIRSATEGEKVRKVGRTTGLTESEVFDTKATIKVDYGPFGYAWFTDCIVVKPAFAQGGDSGSAIISEDNSLIGLLFAGSEYITIANRIENVLTAMGKIGVEFEMGTTLLGVLAVGAILGYFTSEATGMIL